MNTCTQMARGVVMLNRAPRGAKTACIATVMVAVASGAMITMPLEGDISNEKYYYLHLVRSQRCTRQHTCCKLTPRKPHRAPRASSKKNSARTDPWHAQQCVASTFELWWHLLVHARTLTTSAWPHVTTQHTHRVWSRCQQPLATRPLTRHTALD